MRDGRYQAVLPRLCQAWFDSPFRLPLRLLSKLARRAARNVPGVMRFGGMTVEYTDLLSFYMEYKDIFLRRIYHFEPKAAGPFVIDGGGCIGMSALYFKRLRPDARVLCFEPDEDVCGVLARNVGRNGLDGVEVVRAGLSGHGNDVPFLPDGADGGAVADAGPGTRTIRTVRLSEYLDRPVDFLKLNIEGQELPVLREAEASGRFRNVSELVLEYHGWPENGQGLGEILGILDRQGYRYLVHDFDRETCGASKPPFRIRPGTRWYCLVYAKRQGGAAGAAGGTGSDARR